MYISLEPDPYAEPLRLLRDNGVLFRTGQDEDNNIHYAIRNDSLTEPYNIKHLDIDILVGKVHSSHAHFIMVQNGVWRVVCS